jgi:hypothetical protein
MIFQTLGIVKNSCMIADATLMDGVVLRSRLNIHVLVLIQNVTFYNYFNLISTTDFFFLFNFKITFRNELMMSSESLYLFRI